MSYWACEKTCYSSRHSIHAVECVRGWNYKVRRKASAPTMLLCILWMACSDGAVIDHLKLTGCDGPVIVTQMAVIPGCYSLRNIWCLMNCCDSCIV